MFSLVALSVLYYIPLSNAVSVKIDGLIDLGPGWSYEYKIITPKPARKHENKFTIIERFADVVEKPKTKPKIEPITESKAEPKSEPKAELKSETQIDTTTHNENLQIVIKPHKVIKSSGRSKPKNVHRINNSTHKPEEVKMVTKILDDFKNSELYSKPRVIKEDAQINYFTTHIYKQTLKVFKALRLKTSDYRIKKQIDFLSRNYERKFKEFVKDTRKHKIKSRLGSQKVILNTIDISNRILTRLVNFLIGDMDKKGILRNNLATANIYQKEVEKETNLEYNHACKKYGICRAGKTFTDFLSEIMSILLKTNDKQLKLAMDSFTEAFKNADFSRSLDQFTERKLKKAITNLEDMDINLLRALMMIAKNIINNKNRPLIIHNRVSAKINQTLALLELFDIFDKHMPNTEANILEWNDITKSFQQWSEGKRNDILEIMETTVNLFRKSLESMNSKTQQRVENILNIIL